MSGVKYNGVWRSIGSIQCNSYGEWLEHSAVYAKTEGEWKLVDLVAEQQDPAYHIWIIYALNPYATWFADKGVSLTTDGARYMGVRTGNRRKTPVMGVHIASNTDLEGFEWSEFGVDAVSAFIKSDLGVMFKNNTGARKTLTAYVSIGGIPAPDYTNFKYTWYEGELPLYASFNAEYAGTIGGGASYLADGTNPAGYNHRSITVSSSNVPNGQFLNITCSITNI